MHTESHFARALSLLEDACTDCREGRCHICHLKLAQGDVVLCKTCLELPEETETRFARITPSRPRQGD